tara:strand:+ start:364 stop:786 length:423 start_codon:yes stop_codon:yes gene_type:complete
MKQKKYNHLCKVPNTDEGRAFIAKLKYYMKDTESVHRIRLKGRNPIVGAKAYNNGCDGGIRLADAKNIALYLVNDRSSWSNGWSEGYDNAKDYWYHKGVEEGARVVQRNQQYQQGYREGRQDLLEYLQTVINTERLHNEQ